MSGIKVKGLDKETAERIKKVQERYSLRDIKDIFTLRCYNSNFYTTLKFFLIGMQLEWTLKVPTACAYKKGAQKRIGINPLFVDEHCRHEDDIADCLFHELLHHAFRHLDEGNNVTENSRLANVAMDAIINSYLTQIDSAGFMEHFYPDVICVNNEWRPHVFLRPNTENFLVVDSPECNKEQRDKMTREERDELYQKLGQNLSEVDRDKYRKFNAFYQKLYRLEVTLDEGVEFFKEFFPDVKVEILHDKGRKSDEDPDSNQGKNPADSGDEPMPSDAGDHEQEGEGSGSGESDSESNTEAGSGSSEGDSSDDDKDGEGDGDSDEGPGDYESDDDGDGEGKGEGERETEDGDKGDKGDEDESEDDDGENGPSPWKSGGEHEGGYDEPEDDFLEKDTADALLNCLGLKKITKKVKNNFLQIIRKITNSSDRMGGAVRQGSYFSQRVPGKFGKKNALRFGLKKRQYSHGTYKLESFALILDQSGSMWEYIEFSQKLVQWLVKIGKEVRVIIFADTITEFPAEDLIKDKIPDVGGGTCGEVVAQFLQKEKIPEAVIVTDDYAGSLTTPIKAKIHLALVEGSDKNGTFSNRKMVPRCTKYWLEKDKEIEI